MRNDVDFFDVEGVEQGGGVAGELIEVKIGEGLRRFAEADLVRDHDAVAIRAEWLDRGLPIARREISPMQKQRGAPVRIAFGRAISSRSPPPGITNMCTG